MCTTDLGMWNISIYLTTSEKKKRKKERSHQRDTADE